MTKSHNPTLRLKTDTDVKPGSTHFVTFHTPLLPPADKTQTLTFYISAVIDDKASIRSILGNFLP